MRPPLLAASLLPSPSKKIITAHMSIEKHRQYNAPANEPVRVLNSPMMDGPKYPPRFPIELIKPMLPAAAISVRNKLGNDQNAGWYPLMPAAANMKQTA